MFINSLLDSLTIMYALKEVVLVFDINNTLYKQTPNTAKMVRRATYEIVRNKIPTRFSKFYKEMQAAKGRYGSPLQYMINKYKLDKTTVKNINSMTIDLKNHIKTSDDLRSLLERLPCSCFCMTNATSNYSAHVLQLLGLSNVIEGLFCAKYTTEPQNVFKPNMESFQRVDELIGRNGNKKIKVIFFDDSKRNVEAARRFGWIGIHVRNADKITDYIINALKIHTNVQKSLNAFN